MIPCCQVCGKALTSPEIEEMGKSGVFFCKEHDPASEWVQERSADESHRFFKNGTLIGETF